MSQSPSPSPSTTSPTGATRVTRRELALFVAILGVAAALRLWDLARESYWLDELVSVHDAHRTWRSLLRDLSGADVHPPLYFGLLKVWVGWLGSTEVATRSLSVLAGVAAVLFGGLLARRLAGPRAGLTAAALLTFSPFCVYYAREVRGYSLLLALSLAATWLLVRAAPEFRLRSLAAYVPVATALLYTHVYGLFTLAAHGVFALTLLAPGRRRAFFRLAGALATAGVLYLPWAPVTFGQAGRVTRGFWVPRPAPLAWTEAWFAEGAYALVWVVATTALAVIALRRLAREDRPQAILFAASLLLPTAVPIAISYVSQPVFMGKYAISATGLLLVLAGVRASRARIPLLLVGVLCFAGYCDTVRDVYRTRHKEQWRELAAFASAESVAKGIPIVTEYNGFLKVYLDRRATVLPVGHWGLAPDALVQRLAKLKKDRFWLVDFPFHRAWIGPDFYAFLQRNFTETERKEWMGAEAILWVSPGGAATSAPALPALAPAPAQ